MDAEAVEHHGGQLIGLHIAVDLFGVEIRPDDIFRRLHGAAAQLVLRDAEARQMIAVEYDDRRLAERGEPAHKARDKGIRLLELVEVILQPGAAGFGLLPRDPDGSRAFQRLRGILAVGLHGDGEDEIAVLGGAQRLQDLLRQDGILCPAERIPLDVVHVFQRRERLEAEIGIDAVAAVERGVIIMDGVGGIARALQRIGHGFAGSVLDDGLVGILPDAEMVEIHAGEDLELGVRRARADGRHIEQAAGARLLQPLKIWDRIFAVRQVLQIIRVKE